MSKKVLAIHDDPLMLQLIQDGLEMVGYEVITALDGQSGLAQMSESRPDLIILDVLTPQMDGWGICHRIRSISTVPIIILTALGAEEDIVRGLNMGADDYLVKPFDLKELQTRVGALLGRMDMPFPADESLLRFGDDDLVIDLNKQQVMVRGQAVHLTPTEYELLLFMTERAGRILFTNVILNEVWPDDPEVSPDNLKQHIHSLRNKIEDDPHHPRYILTEHSIGYRFVRV
jgi:two-component system KDP operon response regulator KdpE